MKIIQEIYTNDDHQWAVIARDTQKPPYLIDTNEYVISIDSQLMLTDPGGLEIFAEVFTTLSESFDPTAIKYIFASHQDPDIVSSLALWLEVNPKLRCYISWLWSSFIPHFGGVEDTIIPIPDEGMKIQLGSKSLEVIPAHYLHSSGNFQLYDPQAKILFSGDIGAALLPPDNKNIFVENFDEHVQYMEAFHKRWMPSNRAKNDWCQRISNYDIDMLCPQHGSIFKGDDVKKFIDWFANLEVGITK